MVENNQKILDTFKMRGYPKEWLKFGIMWFKPTVETLAYRSRIRANKFCN